MIRRRATLRDRSNLEGKIRARLLLITTQDQDHTTSQIQRLRLGHALTLQRLVNTKRNMNAAHKMGKTFLLSLIIHQDILTILLTMDTP